MNCFAHAGEVESDTNNYHRVSLFFFYKTSILINLKKLVKVLVKSLTLNHSRLLKLELLLSVQLTNC